MNTSVSKFGIALLVILIAFGAGFFLGRTKVETKERVSQIKGETAYGSINPDFLTVRKEFKGDIKFLPYIFWKNDTIVENNIEYIYSTPDSAKILEDFITKREYQFNLYDNETGKVDITQTIQFNRLQSVNYTHTPITQRVETTYERRFIPFASFGYNTLNQVNIGGGVFINNIGLEYNYILGNNIQGHGLSIKVKF